MLAADVNQVMYDWLKVTVCIDFFSLLCLQQGDDRNDSVEEEQAVLVLDMTAFIELILSVKTVRQIHFKNISDALFGVLVVFIPFLQMIDRREEELSKESVTEPLLEGLNREASKVVTILLTESHPDSL